MKTLKELVIRTILNHTDGQLKIINLDAMAEELTHLREPVDWAAIDPKKWGEVEYIPRVEQKGHWEEDDIGKVWVDEEEE